MAKAQIRMMNEARILRSVDHPNVVRLHDIYQDTTKFYLVMEYVGGGDFEALLQSHSRFSEPDAARFLTQLTSGLDYLHCQGIIHRDFKPENILVSSKEFGKEILKIADFGLSKLQDQDEESGDERLRTPCGTPLYMAPEVLRRKGYDHTVDLWSLGVVLYKMLCGYPPFREDNEAQLFNKILNADFDFPERDWDSVSSSAKDLITRLLVVTPSKRYSCSEVLNHPWTRGCFQERPQPTILEMMQGFHAELRFKKAVNTVILCRRLMMRIVARREQMVKQSPARKGLPRPMTRVPSLSLTS